MTSKIKHIATLCRRGYPTAHIYFFYDPNRDEVIIIDTYKWCVRRSPFREDKLCDYLMDKYGDVDIAYLPDDYWEYTEWTDSWGA